MDGTSFAAKALLETDEVVVRGGKKRLALPIAGLSARVDGEQLLLENGRVRVTLQLGAKEAAKWAASIANPKGRLEKLGVVGGDVVLLGAFEAAFSAELVAAGATVRTRMSKGAKVVFLAVQDRTALPRLRAVVPVFARDGVIWTVRPKGSEAVTEADCRAAAREAGLVDVKVVRFSSTHTAEKFVLPKSSR